MLGHGTCNIKVQLNNKDNDEFKKIKSKSAYINLDEKKHVKLLVNRIKYPKRIKLIISNLSSNEPIVISNIQFRNGKFPLENIEKFKVDGAKVVNQDNKLILTPNNNEITLIYPDTLHVRTSMDFDFLVFATILILSYLLAYKLSNYVAEFNTIKGKSRVEIIFLTIFFVFLLIPMVHINKDEISQQENRALAKWKPLIGSNQTINFEFGKNFNEWFNDRFTFRKTLVQIYRQLIYWSKKDYAEIPLGYLYKSNGWMFYNQNQYDINNIFTPLSQDKITQYTDNIEQLIKYCKSNGVKLYIMISPTKEYLYQDNDLVHGYVKNEKTYDLVKNIKDKLGFEILYPVEELVKLKDSEYVCYKTDHHLTDSGSFLIYQLLMQQIRKDFNDIEESTEQDYNISYNNLIRWSNERTYLKGCNYERAGIKDSSLLSTKYKYYDYKNLGDISIVGSHPYYIHVNKAGKYKMLSIGDSFSENLTYFLNTSFYEIRKYRYNATLNIPKRKAPLDITGYIPVIEEYKPDVLLLVLSSGHIDRLEDLYSREDK